MNGLIQRAEILQKQIDELENNLREIKIEYAAILEAIYDIDDYFERLAEHKESCSNEHPL